MPTTTSPQTLKLKSTLRLLIPRLRNAQKKDTALSIASRREMATLLSQNREASARIRVENIIQTDICVEVMEILELYAELLLARAGLLDLRDKEMKDNKHNKDGEADGAGMDSGLEEAAAAMIFAAPRLPRDIRELPMVRSLLVERWGKDFATRVNENKDGIVPERVTKKLRVEPPGDRLVELYLTEIARTYGVDWPRHTEVEGVEDLQEELDDEEQPATTNDIPANSSKDTAQSEPPTAAPTQTPKKTKPDLSRAFDPAELSRATPPRDLGPGVAKSPVSIAPPGARTDNPSPKVKFPGGGEAKAASTAPKATGKSGSGNANVVGGKIPDVDELAKRFRDLKR